MQPFRVPDSLNALQDSYPDGRAVLAVAAANASEVGVALTCQWLSEGVPWAFRQAPGLYEFARQWLAERLAVHPKDITLIGSARLGSSLAPGQVGRPFGACSDLDWSVVSDPLFMACRAAYDRWQQDALAGNVRPANPREAAYWSENAGRCRENLRRGFIDPAKVPLRTAYSETQRIVSTMEALGRKLALTSGAPETKRHTVRAYRDWPSFTRQAVLNLHLVAERLV